MMVNDLTQPQRAQQDLSMAFCNVFAQGIDKHSPISSMTTVLVEGE